MSEGCQHGANHVSVKANGPLLQSVCVCVRAGCGSACVSVCDHVPELSVCLGQGASQHLDGGQEEMKY